MEFHPHNICHEHNVFFSSSFFFSCYKMTDITQQYRPTEKEKKV